MTTLKPTAEQAAIVITAARGEDMVIEAGAGTGKTSTLRLIAQRLGRRTKGLYLAYNRAIRDDAATTFPRAVRCSTAHSYAFAAVGRRHQHRIDMPRQPAHRTAEILGISGPVNLASDLEPLSAAVQARLAMATVARFCATADLELNDVHIPWQFGFTQPLIRKAFVDALLPYARSAWKDLNDPKGQLRLAHDHYLKMWQLTNPIIRRDYILFDEAQDADPVIAAIVAAQPCQLILVGDANQAIYGWRGAVDAMSGFPGPRHSLSQSWRFGQVIADVANEWLDLLDSDLRLAGHPGRTSHVTTLDLPDAVLCRTNSYAVARALDAIERGIRVAIVGGGTDIAQFARAAIDLQQGRGTDHPQLLAFGSWDLVREYARSDDGADIRLNVDLIDRHGATTILNLVADLTDESSADLVISTVHKAKGREWDRVQVGDDFHEPTIDHERPAVVRHEQAEVSRAEAMLAYVAVTRARHTLDPDGLAWLRPSVHWCRPPDRTSAPLLQRPTRTATPPDGGQPDQLSLWEA